MRAIKINQRGYLMEDIADPMISASGMIYSLAGLRRLLKALAEEENSGIDAGNCDGERLCG